MKMKVSLIGLYTSLLFTPFPAAVHSFPTLDNFAKLVDTSDFTPEKLNEALLHIKEKRASFDPLTTPISVTGDHAFRAPNFANGDQRGPCPGLNALANHGYLSRDGVVSYLDVIVAANTVYGMGVDLGGLLSIVSVATVGNALSLKPSFSIGGVSSKVSNLLGNVGGLLGTPGGLDATHNLIEVDGSNTRDDVYVTGDAWTMNMTKFLEVYNSIDANGAMTVDDLAARASKRFDESIATNPYFYYGPYSGAFVRSAGYLFAGRFLSNHSRDYPRGSNLTRDVFASFWGVSNVQGSLVYNKGCERIPENWYRIATDYGFADIFADLSVVFAKYPRLFSGGGNLGAVNTFAGLDYGNITGGIINGANILEGNNFACFVLEVLKLGTPSLLASVYSSVAGPLALVSSAIDAPLLNLSCPVFSDLKMGGTDLLSGLKAKYPGAKKAGIAL